MDQHLSTTGASRAFNPATGELLAEHPFQQDVELERRLEAARLGFATWRTRTVEQRAALLTRLGSEFRSRLEPMARLAALEMGKPIKQARAEVEKCAALCDWYAAHGERFLADEPAVVPTGRAFVSFLPIGTILGIMPWNFPYWQAMRAAVPILLGGNCFLLKPAENVVGCSGMLAEAVQAAGLPDGVFTVAHVTRKQTARIIGDPRIVGVTLTGSVAAGRTIAALAAQHVKKSLLELGGSDPFIVLRDADLGAAARNGALARFQNCGQVCIAAKRFIVAREVAEEFTFLLAREVAALEIGDPLDEMTYLGPMARLDLRAELGRQIKATLAQGGRLVAGGHPLKGEGAWQAPTIIAGVEPGMTAFDQETFGPLAALSVADGLEHAIQLANASAFGLSAALWTADEDAAPAVARRLETGSVFVNSYAVSDPHLPIGGVKSSGYGRELSHFGIHEFANAQAVWIDRQ